MHDISFNESKQEFMSDLLRRLKDDLFVSKITREELAKHVGIAKSTLSDILNEKTEISFNYLVKIIMKLYDSPAPTLRNDMISEYLAYAKPENQREAMEYAAFRREFGSLKEIIDKELNSTTEMNREWAKVYNVIYEHCREKNENEPKYDPYNFYDDLDDLKSVIASKEMKTLIEILKCQTLYQMKEYKVLFKRIAKVEKKINKTANKFIRNSHLVRMKEGMIVTYLMQNEVVQAREHCNGLLDICDKNPDFLIQKASAYFSLGESYLFESYEQSKKMLEKSLFILENGAFTVGEDVKRKKQRVENTLIFLKIHHYRDIQTLPQVLDKVGYAYLELKKGNKMKAESILLEIEKENGYLNEFETCYMGLAKDDKYLLEKSHKMFLEKKSLFYAKIPQLYLGYN